MDTAMTLQSGEPTMSSREIAELTGKHHGHVCRDIRVMLVELEIAESKFGSSYVDRSGKQSTEFHLPRRECEILVTGYDVRRRAAVIDRWLLLETATTRQPLALPTAKELALMVLRAEEEKEAARAEAQRLNQVCNTVTRQFIPGETAARFCMQLNGVNCQQVQGWLVSRGHLINEGRRGYRPSAETRDRYFKLYVTDNNGKETYQAQLTQKGCRWLYNKYLKGDLPMKKTWDGRFTHGVFEQRSPLATVMTGSGFQEVANV